MKDLHHYSLTVNWTGNKGTGTSQYRAYERSYTIFIDNKAEILGSSDPAFRGDKTKHNPEEMLLAAVSSCHMLWYLHLCSTTGIIVTGYTDNATGTMIETADGGEYFQEITLTPVATISGDFEVDKANELHTKANGLCYIANSVNFPIHHHPVYKSAETPEKHS